MRRNHEPIRNDTNTNETETLKSLIKNGKYYVPPPGDGADFKTLFQRVIASGAGRPVDREGFPVSQWTPELLAEAISNIDFNRAGVDLRTVQLWFQDNERGISADNIRWLSRILGCGDPDASGAWQVEISAANRRLATKRKMSARSTEEPPPMGPVEPAGLQATPTGEQQGLPQDDRDRSLAKVAEALFIGTGSLTLPIAIWTIGGLLWLLVYIVGVHSITYTPIEGVAKQVGFLWAPSWTLDRMLFISMCCISASGTLTYWKAQRRVLEKSGSTGSRSNDQWSEKLRNFEPSFWTLLFVCLMIVFLVQWTGVYVRPLVRGIIGSAMVDWILVALVRPDVVTVSEAIALSGLANLYSGFVYWCYFCGLLLLYLVASDYRDIGADPNLRRSGENQAVLIRTGEKVLVGIYRSIVLGLFAATSIKLNAVYLISDAENLLSWLINDAVGFLRAGDAGWGWLAGSPSAFMTSFFVLFITCFTFFICLIKISQVFDVATRSNATAGSSQGSRTEDPVIRIRNVQRTMAGVVLVLAANFFLIGQFRGFSILLLGSVSVALVSMVKTGWRQT